MNLSMNKLRKLLFYLLHDRSKIRVFLLQKISRCYSDEKFLKRLFKLSMGYELNLDNPQTFNEKLQWLKLYNRKPEYTQMVDKYAVKEYVANIIGEEYIIPTLGIWDRVEDIDWEALPNQFVLKTTHSGGNTGVVICKDKTKFDKTAAAKKLCRSLKQDIFISTREWPYKDVPRRIIAEQYMEIRGQKDLPDYKFFCFDGEPKAMLVASGRYIEPETCFDYFDMEFNHLPFEQGGPNYHKHIEKPLLFEEMKEVAAKLSQNLIHARIDLYEVNGMVKFGEITFFDSSGFAEFKPKEWDYRFGEWIKLP